MGRKRTKIGWLYDKARMDRLQDLEAGQLWRYLGNHRVYRCPADPQPDFGDPDAVTNRPYNTRMITSYCMNGSVCRYGGAPFLTDRRQWRTHLVSEFKVDDVIFWEPWEGTASIGWWWDGSNFPHEGVTWRHFSRATIACADGHVERITTTNYCWLANTAPRPNRLWNTPRAAGGLR